MSPKKLELFCLADNPICLKDSVKSLKASFKSGSIFVVFEVTFLEKGGICGSCVFDATAVLVDCDATVVLVDCDATALRVNCAAIALLYMSPTDLLRLLLVILAVGYSTSVKSHSKFGSVVSSSTGLGVLLERLLESPPFSVS